MQGSIVAVKYANRQHMKYMKYIGVLKIVQLGFKFS